MATSAAIGTVRLLNPGAAAIYLDASPITLAMWRGQSRGPKYVKLGRLVKYDVADLDTYIANNKT